MENHQLVLVLDFGGQYNQLIARRVREHNVYCEVKPYKTSIEEIKALNPIGIIFTGGPNSVYLENSPRMSKEIFELGVPVLGICYGVQFMACSLGGEIVTLGTDAHTPGFVGCAVREGQALLRACGFRRFAAFRQGKPVWHEL